MKLKTMLVALVGLGLLWLALVAELSATELYDSIPSTHMSGTGPDTRVLNEWGREHNATDDTYRANLARRGRVVVNGLQVEVIDYRGIKPKVEDYRCDASPYEGQSLLYSHECQDNRLTFVPGLSEEDAMDVSYRQILEDDPCDLMARHWLGMPQCSRLERAIQETLPLPSGKASAS